MKQHFRIPFAALVFALTAVQVARAQTLARLGAAPTADIPRDRSALNRDMPTVRSYRSVALRESMLSRSAATALFVRSDLKAALRLAARALVRDKLDAEALFVQMEAAGMAADDTTVLKAGLDLCRLAELAPGDLRVVLAAARVREEAANTPEFRSIIPDLLELTRKLESVPQDLHTALLNAAMDGAPGLDPYTTSRAAGILTDWRIVGPLRRHSSNEVDPSQIAEVKDLANNFYQNRPVENFQFPDGRIVLPQYLSHRGTFYGVSGFASLTEKDWILQVEGAGRAEVFLDGRLVLRLGAEHDRASIALSASAGPHRVLLKFAQSDSPYRVTIAPALVRQPSAGRQKRSAPELAYLLAADSFADQRYADAIQQIDAVAEAGNSPALRFLLARSCTMSGSAPAVCATAWDKVLALLPEALEADIALSQRALAAGDAAQAVVRARQVLDVRPQNRRALEIMTIVSSAAASGTSELAELWERRLRADPSCEAWQGAVAFYRQQRIPDKAMAAVERMSGCSPESMDYVQSLSAEGRHAEAVAGLQQLIAAAPLNRSARQLLVSELQLSGQDTAAQLEAAEWLRIAPNAATYHRLAADSDQLPAAASNATSRMTDGAFYAPYRRDARALMRGFRNFERPTAGRMLLNDHVAILRPDGSVSLYVHIARRLRGEEEETAYLSDVTAAGPAQILSLRLIHADGSAEQLDPASLLPEKGARGDVLDEETVTHYAGDGGMQEHPEAFQFVFGGFDRGTASERFVVLTPAQFADRGVVISTGNGAAVTTEIRNGVLQRMWEDSCQPAESAGSSIVIRVVEEDNGWTIPSKAEHQRHIETIHPGPRAENS